MLSAWPFVVALLLVSAGTPPPAVPDAAEPHVRAASALMRRLIDETAARSPIVRELVARLGCSDVIVYVELTASAQVPRARTTLVTATPAVRFLRIGISSSTPSTDLPALLGHELQHAVEIAEREEVRDAEGVRRLYLEIGRQGSGDSFETDAALDVEWHVRLECRQHAETISPGAGDRPPVAARVRPPGLRPD